MKLDRTIQMTLTALTLCATAGLASGQTTWYVDDDHPNDPTPGASGLGFPFSNPNETGASGAPFDDIQKAIDAASNGDTVLVRPSNWFGYYALTTTFGTLDFLGKDITVKSTGGPGVTAIDGNLLPNLSGILIDGSGSAALLEGFTIQNCDAGSVAGDNGGGLLITNSTATVRNCRFVNNHAYRGAGLAIKSASPTIDDCLFLANTAVHQGGGLFGDGGEAHLLDCTFESNLAKYGAGALFRTVSGNNLRVDDCLFLKNEATVGYGGGLAKFDVGVISIRRTRFVQNIAATTGSAFQVHGSSVIDDSAFIGNVAATGTINTDNGGNGGAGLTVVDGSTFTENVGGACTETAGNLLMHNCIAWNNSPFELGADVVAEHCDVLGGWPGLGNIDADPQFKDPFGVDGIPGTQDDDLRLMKTSPCIDAGDTMQLAGGSYPTDSAGNPRAVDDPATPNTGITSLWLTTDIGAFEYQPPSASCVRAKSTTLTLNP